MVRLLTFSKDLSVGRSCRKRAFIWAIFLTDTDVWVLFWLVLRSFCWEISKRVWSRCFCDECQQPGCKQTICHVLAIAPLGRLILCVKVPKSRIRDTHSNCMQKTRRLCSPYTRTKKLDDQRLRKKKTLNATPSPLAVISTAKCVLWMCSICLAFANGYQSSIVCFFNRSFSALRGSVLGGVDKASNGAKTKFQRQKIDGNKWLLFQSEALPSFFTMTKQNCIDRNETAQKSRCIKQQWCKTAHMYAHERVSNQEERGKWIW